MLFTCTAQWQRRADWRARRARNPLSPRLRPRKIKPIVPVTRLAFPPAAPISARMSTTQFGNYRFDFSPPQSRAERIARLDALANLLDTAILVPGTNIRFGIDAMIGLIPGIGDAITTLMSLYIVREARELGVPRHVIARMLANVALDGVVGAVPFLGDAFDVMWRSNRRNMALLRKHSALESGDDGSAGRVDPPSPRQAGGRSPPQDRVRSSANEFQPSDVGRGGGLERRSPDVPAPRARPIRQRHHRRRRRPFAARGARCRGCSPSCRNGSSPRSAKRPLSCWRRNSDDSVSLSLARPAAMSHPGGRNRVRTSHGPDQECVRRLLRHHRAGAVRPKRGSQSGRTIRLVVPVPPGASTDAVARLMAEQIGRAQGVTIVVENRPGASGMIGTEEVSRAAPTATRC